MHFTVRPAEQRDAEALGQLGAMLVRAHYTFDRDRFLEPHPSIESGYASFLEEMRRLPDALVLVAEAGGAVVGYLYAAMEPMSWKELRGPAGFIHDLAVTEDARGAGVGEELMRAAQVWLRERGAPRVMLWTAAPNEGAQRLFNRLGFRPTMVEMTLELGQPGSDPKP